MALRCSKCGKEKDASEFHANRSSRRGKQAYCIGCQRDYQREYILPALRGRGKNRTLPAWAADLVMRRPIYTPAKVLHLDRHEDPPLATVRVAGRLHPTNRRAALQ